MVWVKGSKHSEESKARMSQSQRAAASRRTPESRSAGTIRAREVRWENSERLEDMSAKRGALHKLVHKTRGRAALLPCAQADNTCTGRMEWANISGEYRDVDDFMPLCKSHHRRYDDSPEWRAAISRATTREQRSRSATASWTPERRAEQVRRMTGSKRGPRKRQQP